MSIAWAQYPGLGLEESISQSIFIEYQSDRTFLIMKSLKGEFIEVKYSRREKVKDIVFCYFEGDFVDRMYNTLEIKLKI